MDTFLFTKIYKPVLADSFSWCRRAGAHRKINIYPSLYGGACTSGTEEGKQSEIKDTLPVSGSGKLITTVEPKFEPKEAIDVTLGEDVHGSCVWIDWCRISRVRCGRKHGRGKRTYGEDTMVRL